MVFDWLGWISTLTIGAAAGALTWSCSDYYRQALDWVEKDVGEKLRRIRSYTPKLRAYLIAWSAGIGLLFLFLWTAFDAFVLGFVISLIFLGGPWYVINRMAAKRKERLEDQLADAMVTLASATKAGLALIDALKLLAENMARPISEEFQQIVGEYEMGKTIERVMTEAKERLDSENFTLFSAAVLASRESGGKLNETITRIAESVREMQRLERKVKAETAQARKSAVYMALAPGLILVVYYFVDPVNTTRLFVTVPGQILLSVSLLLNVLSYLWARRILNPDI